MHLEMARRYAGLRGLILKLQIGPVKVLLKPLSTWLKRPVPWTHTIPKEPGYYWWRENENSPAEVVFLARPTMGRTLYVEARAPHPVCRCPAAPGPKANGSAPSNLQSDYARSAPRAL